jgi:hypothetical protein
MNEAERLINIGTGSTTLPVSGITVKYRAARNRQLAYAGLLPLRLTELDLSDMDETERQDALDNAQRSMERLVCECSLEPKIVKRKPRKGQVHIENVCDDDLSHLFNLIMDKTVALYNIEAPATEHKKQDQCFLHIAAMIRVMPGLSPLEVLRATPAEFEDLNTLFEILRPKED